MRTRTKIGGVVAATAAVVAMAGVAFAEGNGSPVTLSGNLFHREALVGADNSPSTCSTIRWLNTRPTMGDSPIDTNRKALFVNVCAGDYADAYTRAALHIDKPAGQVKNLSYDFKAMFVGAGAPRISVIFKNGDVAYLAASTCSRPIAVSGSTKWSRADFTGAKSNCFFHVTSSDAPFDTVYAADGTRSAWQNYALANPDQVVSYDFIVFDETGRFIVDRISLGTDRLYNYADNYAVNCHQNEHVC